MAESDSDVLEINVDPEDEKKNCEGVLVIIVLSRQNYVRTEFWHFFYVLVS
jgi:hypothetical protein